MSAVIERVRRPVAKNVRPNNPLKADTVNRLLGDIRKLAPEIAARAAEIEAGRRMPLDLVEALRSIGVFRIFVPQSRGGLELDLPSGLEIIAALGRIDGSVGWTTMITSGGSIFAPLLPRDTFEQVYQHGPDVVLAGSMQPTGTAEATPGGWRVSGRWPFASGCQHADWIFGFCVMAESGNPLPGDGGRPQVRGFGLPARAWQIEDTWHVAGLKGTGSHHITLNDAVVPAANFFDLENGLPSVPGPLYQTVPQLLPLLHSANTVGIAEGAWDDLLELVNTGRQQFRAATPMRESEIFQFELGRIGADLRAARASLEVQAAIHWRHALARTLKSDDLLAQSTQTGIWIAATCIHVADTCFRLAGGGAVYETSPLQRRMRDLHAAAQHFVVQQRHYIAAGKVTLAQSRRQFDDAARLAAE